ncbi:BrnT family toxin [Kushneria aurantia]|uniref:BrnT family toxin n=1 Tax=Kushneria aurantia TaxID=504092 RepID=A0ABV6G3B3_9GAMM|nr:BrnT family toxin [Kushneria aurantia]
MMKIDFDPVKDGNNRDKHGVSLTKGAAVLADPERLEMLDIRFTHIEERLIAYGKVGERVWVCVFTMREQIHRIISVRKANERETRRYHNARR